MRSGLLLFVLSSCVLSMAQTHSSAGTATRKRAAVSGPPTAIIDTTAGKLTCTLFPDKAPTGVANFIGLAKGTKDWTNPSTGAKMHGVPLYNGTIFHRVIPEFMIQGGDPAGTGAGEIGFTIKDELRPDLLYDHPGRLAYANRGPNTSGSQFFITEVLQPNLNPCFDEGGCQRGYRRVPKDSGYTIFGQCDDASVELVKRISHAPRDENDRPENPVKINKITILRASGSATHATSPTAKPKAPPQTTKPQ